MRRAREVLRLKLAAGVSAREIARRLALAPSTVRATIERFAAAGLSWPLPEPLPDAVLEAQAPGCAGAVFQAVGVALPPLFRRLDAEKPAAPTGPPSPKPRKRRLTPRKRSATSAAKNRIHKSNQ